jgi:hypothetical protein
MQVLFGNTSTESHLDSFVKLSLFIKSLDHVKQQHDDDDDNNNNNNNNNNCRYVEGF